MARVESVAELHSTLARHISISLPEESNPWAHWSTVLVVAQRWTSSTHNSYRVRWILNQCPECCQWRAESVARVDEVDFRIFEIFPPEQYLQCQLVTREYTSAEDLLSFCWMWTISWLMEQIPSKVKFEPNIDSERIHYIFESNQSAYLECVNRVFARLNQSQSHSRVRLEVRVRFWLALWMQHRMQSTPSPVWDEETWLSRFNMSSEWSDSPNNAAKCQQKFDRSAPAEEEEKTTVTSQRKIWKISPPYFHPTMIRILFCNYKNTTKPLF